jgi:hypothetical protein
MQLFARSSAQPSQAAWPTAGRAAPAANPARPWARRRPHCYVGPATMTPFLPRHPEREEPTALCRVWVCAAGVAVPVATVARWAAMASPTGTAREEQ